MTTNSDKCQEDAKRPELPKQFESKTEIVPNDSTNETKTDSTKREWRDIGNLSLVYDGSTDEFCGDNISHVIYLWTEIRDGEEYPCYVGQTTQKIHRRCKIHLKSKREYLFQRSLRKRTHVFKCYIVQKENNLDSLNKIETEYIQRYNTYRPENFLAYNLTLGGNNYHLTDEIKKKISDKLKGRVFSVESKRKMSESQKRVVRDWEISSETRMKLSIAMTKRKWTDKMRSNMSKSVKGRKLSESWKKNMSLARIGKPKGPHSEETKRKLSLAAKIQFHTATSKEIEEYKMLKENT